MIDPTLVTDAVVDALRSNSELVQDMNGDPARIRAYHFLYGQDNQLSSEVYSMRPPAVLVAWDGTRGGNFDGATIFRHRVVLYIRAGKTLASRDPVGYERIWHHIVNGAVLGTGLNIRQVQLLPVLDIMDVPSVTHRVDETKADMFVGVFDFPEIGDN